MAQGSLTQPVVETIQDTSSRGGRVLRILAGLFIAGFFLFFTWRGLLLYYTGDDLMNLYGYWSKPVSSLVKANIFFWTPYYRPFGGVIYRIIFGLFGFNPVPLYIVYFAAMLLNLWVAYLVFKRIGGSREIGAIATLLWAFHGKLDYLYYNAGSMYDVFCFLFFFLALLIYLKAREQGRFLGVWGMIGFLVCFVCALNSKEMAATLPVIVLVFELLFHPPDFRKVRTLIPWCLREGRMALLGALVVLIYLPGKLGSDGLATYSAYIPVYSWARWLQDTETYLGDLFYRNNPAVPLGVTPLSGAAVACFYGVLRCYRGLDEILTALVRAALLHHRPAAGFLHSGPAGLRALSATGWPGALRGGLPGAFQRKPLPTFLAGLERTGGVRLFVIDGGLGGVLHRGRSGNFSD